MPAGILFRFKSSITPRSNYIRRADKTGSYTAGIRNSALWTDPGEKEL